MTNFRPIADALYHALLMQGGCLCVLGYDLKVVGEPCGMCRAKAEYENAKKETTDGK